MNRICFYKASADAKTVYPNAGNTGKYPICPWLIHKNQSIIYIYQWQNFDFVCAGNILLSEKVSHPSALFQFNFVEANQLNEHLPEITNPDIVTLSDENVVFNLIEDVHLESEPLPTSISNFVLKIEPPDITTDPKTEGIC